MQQLGQPQRTGRPLQAPEGSPLPQRGLTGVAEVALSISYAFIQSVLKPWKGMSPQAGATMTPSTTAAAFSQPSNTFFGLLWRIITSPRHTYLQRLLSCFCFSLFSSAHSSSKLYGRLSCEHRGKKYHGYLLKPAQQLNTTG